MSAAIDARGLKRVCVSCGIRFYDFNKRPIECPNCDTEYTGEIKVKGRRGKSAADAEKEKEKKAKAAPVMEQIDRDDDVVSLEDLDEGADDDLEDDEAEIEDLDDLDDVVDEEIVIEVDDKE